MCAVKIMRCSSEEAIEEAVRAIYRGGLVVYPTDTVYGLGCDPFNEEAVERVFRVKGRLSRPLPILVSSMERAERLVDLGSVGATLASNFWPGALTIVAPIKRGVPIPKNLTCGFTTLGIRVPNHSCALRLIEGAGGYLVGTSANRSGEKPSLTVDEAVKSLQQSVDLYLDGGSTALGKESTVLDISGEKPKVVREGAISKGTVFGVLRSLGFPI
jgi:L-threonylcarbamoyladenylate synthase